MNRRQLHARFERDDASLLDALAGGSGEAVSFLFDAHARPLHAYCLAITRDGAMAEDAVQEAFVRLWERREGFTDLLSARAFLYRVGRNLSLDMLKHENVRQKHELALGRELNEDFLDEKLVEEELLSHLYRAIELLPAGCVQVFKLSLAGAGNQEIADRLSISIHTVKTQKQRALHALKERFNTK
ncbi:MAG: sigma-70 family RNA polymerase sigma factor [Odoribacteraceae bacterium]|jgi:RNA polymerase sigma-70 factor (ECF subfamily)|nr:sigma-70 family RNA polymerase sigma factor [Odoribacteraceae bacterium]